LYTLSLLLRTAYIRIVESNESLLLRGPEVARALNISRGLAYRWMAKGLLPTVRVPGTRSIRVPRESLLRWIERNTRPASGDAP
jgi:excisionase family DNA binding protein